MVIQDAKSAHEFVAAWAGESAARRARAFKGARESQLANAGMDLARGRKEDEANSRAAASVLEVAERAAVEEASR